MPQLVSTLLFVFFGLTPLWAQRPPEMVKAQLVSEQRAVVPGQPFTVGLYLEHKKGWHTYWENPGDVGIPPMFKWKLPEGWSAGPVQYQAPQRVKMFDITAHGFSGTTALHLVELTPPAELKEGAVTLAADVTWMLCGRSCHPGTYPFALELPVAGKSAADPAWRKAFDAVRAEHPRRSPAWSARAWNLASKKAVSEQTVSEQDQAGGSSGMIVLELRPVAAQPDSSKPGPKRAAPATDPLFYGLDKQVFSNRPHQVERNPDGTPPGTLRFRLPRTDYGPKDKAELDAVIERPGGWHADGTLRYLRVTAAFGEGSESAPAQADNAAQVDNASPKHRQTIPRQDGIFKPATTVAKYHKTVRFSALGCGPYNADDAVAIRRYIVRENALFRREHHLWPYQRKAMSEFLIHLGDINSGAAAREGEVDEDHFKDIRTLLTGDSRLPTYIVPGDNEWTDMPNPDQAWRWWFAHLQYLNELSSPAWTTARQHERPENFAFVHNGVLFIGINLPGGLVRDPAEWRRRFGDNNRWIGEQLAAHRGSERVRAAVVFCQANLIGAGKIKAIVAERFRPFREGFEPHAAAFEKPLLVLHADGHKWLRDRPFANAPNVLRAQVDRADPNFPPLQVTIPAAAQPEQTFLFDRRLDDPAWRAAK